MEKLYKETQAHKENSAHKEEEINQLNGKTKDLEQQLSQLTNLHQAKELEWINVQQKHQETVDKLNNEILELKNSFAEIKVYFCFPDLIEIIRNFNRRKC